MLRYKILLIFWVTCFLPSLVSAESVIPCDVLIDVGHGGIDGGTSKEGILEKNINLAVAKKLYEKLHRQGYTVKLTRSEDIALSDEDPSKIGSRHLRDLQRRKWIANAVNPKLFISLHVNWSKKKSYRGPIVFYQRKNEESFRFAEIAQKQLNTVFGIERKSMKGSRYFLLNRLEMPAVIVEMGFLSNWEDFKMLQQEQTQERLSTALVQAVKEYFKIENLYIKKDLPQG